MAEIADAQEYGLRTYRDINRARRVVQYTNLQKGQQVFPAELNIVSMYIEADTMILIYSASCLAIQMHQLRREQYVCESTEDISIIFI